MRPGEKASVVIVEDEQIVALDLEERLTAMGYVVAGIAADGEEALEKVTRQRPSVVLMDIKLYGEMDGIEAAIHIRERLDIPIIYVTAFADDTTLSRAAATDPYGYVLKPFEDRELEVVLEIALHRHASDRRVRWSEGRLAATLGSVADAVVTADATGRIELMNRKAQELTGWSEEEARGRDAAEVLRVAEPEPGAEGPWESALVSREGGEKVVECQVTDLVGPGGRREGVVWVCRDVTRRRRVRDGERLLAGANALCATLSHPAILESVRSLVLPYLGDWFVLDQAAGSRGLRTGGPLLLGHREADQEEQLRRIFRQRGVLSPEVGVGRALASGRAERRPSIPGAAWLGAALAVTAGDSELAPLMATTSLVFAPLVVGGRALGVLSIGLTRRRHDELDERIAEGVAQRIATAMDNAHLYEAAQRAVKVRDDILAIVSHDLRAPLTTIVLNAGLILEGGTVRQRDRLRPRTMAMLRSTERMRGLVDSLVDLGSIEAGRLILERECIAVQTLMGEAIEMFSAPAAKKGISLSGISPPRETEVLCDKERLLQALANLLGNALKFTGPGGAVTLAAERRGGEIRFRVSDTGPGIPAEQLPHLFERYWRGWRRGLAGAGLGLYIVKGIVDAHGGAVSVESRPGKGTTFTITIPSPAPCHERSAARP